QSSVAATSASRSVPVSCVGFVSRTRPPKPLTRVAIRRSSVATMTCDTIGDAETRRYTCAIIGRPSISASAFPGSRVEAYRAGMTATTFSGGAESTFGAVETGRTTNNSTPLAPSCYDLQAHTMKFKRTATIVVVGAVLAAWLAGAATSKRIIPPPIITPPQAIDARGAELTNEIARLRDRLRHTAVTVQPRRNL